MPTQAVPSIKFLFSETFRFVRIHYINLIAILALPVLLDGLLLAAIPYLHDFVSTVHSTLGTTARLAYGVGLIFTGIALPFFSLYINAVAIKYIINSNSGILGVKNAYSRTLPYILSFLWVAVLYLLIMFGTSVLFIIPGIIAMIFICFSQYIVLDGTYKGISALSCSTALVRGNWWKIFGRIVIIGLFSVLIYALVAVAVLSAGSLIAGSGSFVDLIQSGSNLYSLSIRIATMVASLFVLPYVYTLYNSLKQAKGQSVTEEALKKFRPMYIGLSIWGLIVGVLFVLITIAIVFVSAFAIARERASVQSVNESLVGTATVKYVAPNGTFELSYPNTWEVSKEEDCTYFIAPFRSYDSLSRGSVMICEFPVYPGTTLEGLSQSVKNEFTTSVQDVANERQTIKTEMTTLSGLPAITYFTSKKRSFDGGSTFIAQISEETFTFKGLAGYNVAYKNNIIEYESLRPTGIQVVNSFKLLK